MINIEICHKVHSQTKICVHIGKNVVNMRTQNYKSTKISRNLSSPGDMTNIQT